MHSIGQVQKTPMANTVRNLLTINGTEEQVTRVRDIIKGANGEPISCQSFWPMPKKLKGKKMVEVKEWPVSPNRKSYTLPDWVYWRLKNWGTIWDAEQPIPGDPFEAPNRILFNTGADTPVTAMKLLSLLFPEITFNVIFSDSYVKLYCGEYTITGGEVTDLVWFDAINKVGDISVDQQMEYYFRTHEHERKYWKKNEDGEWVDIDDEDQCEV